MSGHSKWHNIKRKKAVNDAKKSAIFSKMSRAILVAARQGGGDPDQNPTLRLALEKARDAGMPKDNIAKAIAKATGGGESVNFEEAVYEGFGVDGVAFMVTALTDNKNRTVSEVRNIFNKHGGSLGSIGSTSYIFSSDPENPIYEITITDDQKIQKLEDLVEALENHDDVQEVYANYTFVENQ